MDEHYRRHDPAFRHEPTNIHYMFHEKRITSKTSKRPSETEKAVAGVIVSILKGLVLLYVGLGVLFCLAYLWFEVL